MSHAHHVRPVTAAIGLLLASMAVHAQAPSDSTGTQNGGTLTEVQVLGTAEEELRQAPGVSTITAEDIEKRPPVNDLSEIIRTQPGVNLTGNSTSGQRGNNRPDRHPRHGTGEHAHSH